MCIRRILTLCVSRACLLEKPHQVLADADHYTVQPFVEWALQASCPFAEAMPIQSYDCVQPWQTQGTYSASGIYG